MTITASTCGMLLGGLVFALFPQTPESPGGGFRADLDGIRAAGPPDVEWRVPRAPDAKKGTLGEVGQWLPPLEWPVITIHSAMLSNGQVLQYAYPGGGAFSVARMWNPATGQFTPAVVPNDLFCSGLTFLADGTLYVTGGNNTHCDFQGRQTTNFFDPDSASWSFGDNMLDGRWYPTPVTLGDGSVVITSGLNALCENNLFIERYVPGAGIELISLREMALFPRLHLLTSGLIAHVGPENWTSLFDPDADEWTTVDNTNLGWRCEGTSVLVPGYPDMVMIIGGMCPLTSSVEVIDFGSTNPHWVLLQPMNYARGHADVLILPDKTLLVQGGGTLDLYENPQLVPEIFDPQTQTWTELPPHVYGRMYHSTLVLLPDGRVLSAGQDSGPSMFFGEIYEPAYLFRGARPDLTATPQRVAYGRPFSIAGSPAGGIGSVGLIAPTTNTHSFNNSQRYVDLDFEMLDAGALTATGPASGNHAPPGFYMLFIVTPDGVPSVAQFVQVGPWLTGDIDGDGTIGVLDLLDTLGAWGPCAGCDADVNGDGVTDVLDLLLVLGNWTT